MSEFEIIRGSVDGKEKYCRIPIRSKTAELMVSEGTDELNAATILSMPHQQAVNTIDAIIADWMYWLKRAGELFVQNQGLIASAYKHEEGGEG